MDDTDMSAPASQVRITSLSVATAAGIDRVAEIAALMCGKAVVRPYRFNGAEVGAAFRDLWEEHVGSMFGGGQAMQQSPAHGIPAPGGLSAREAEILALIAAGARNQEIAERLTLSVRTVERHITNLYNKLGVRSRAEATAWALRNGVR